MLERIGLGRTDADPIAKPLDNGSSIHQADKDHGITALQVLSLLWLRKWLVLSCISIAVGLTILSLLIVDSRYEVRMTIIEYRPLPELSMSVQNNASFNVLQQIGLNREVTQFDFALSLMETTEFAERLLRHEALVKRLFPRNWDKGAGQWVVPTPGFADRVRDSLWSALGHPRERPAKPTPTVLLDFIASNVLVQRHRTMPAADISVEFKDPELGRLLLRIMHQELDALFREREQAQLDMLIGYVARKLPSVTLQGHRQVLTEVLSSLEWRQIRMGSNNPAVADLLQPPVASTNPTWPKVEVFLVLSVIAGLLVGALLVVGLGRPPTGVDHLTND